MEHYLTSPIETTILYLKEDQGERERSIDVNSNDNTAKH